MGGDSGINTPFVNKAEEIIIYDISGKETIDGVKFASYNEIIGKHFDLIVCRQVLEHTSYPDQILNEIRDFMDSDTLLYVDVPHELIMMNPRNNRSVFKKHWHEHINYFSEVAIKVLFKKCHLDIIKLSSDKVNTHANHSNHFRVIARSNF